MANPTRFLRAGEKRARSPSPTGCAPADQADEVCDPAPAPISEASRYARCFVFKLFFFPRHRSASEDGEKFRKPPGAKKKPAAAARPPTAAGPSPANDDEDPPLDEVEAALVAQQVLVANMGAAIRTPNVGEFFCAVVDGDPEHKFWFGRSIGPPRVVKEQYLDDDGDVVKKGTVFIPCEWFEFDSVRDAGPGGTRTYNLPNTRGKQDEEVEKHLIFACGFEPQPCLSVKNRPYRNTYTLSAAEHASMCEECEGHLLELERIALLEEQAGDI